MARVERMAVGHVVAWYPVRRGARDKRRLMVGVVGVHLMVRSYMVVVRVAASPTCRMNALIEAGWWLLMNDRRQAGPLMEGAKPTVPITTRAGRTSGHTTRWMLRGRTVERANRRMIVMTGSPLALSRGGWIITMDVTMG